jgi:hypothetical protein
VNENVDPRTGVHHIRKKNKSSKNRTSEEPDADYVSFLQSFSKINKIQCLNSYSPMTFDPNFPIIAGMRHPPPIPGPIPGPIPPTPNLGRHASTRVEYQHQHQTTTTTRQNVSATITIADDRRGLEMQSRLRPK